MLYSKTSPDNFIGNFGILNWTVSCQLCLDFSLEWNDLACLKYMSGRKFICTTISQQSTASKQNQELAKVRYHQNCFSAKGKWACFSMHTWMNFMGPTSPRLYKYRWEDWQGLATDPLFHSLDIAFCFPRKCAVITIVSGTGQVPCSRQKKKQVVLWNAIFESYYYISHWCHLQWGPCCVWHCRSIQKQSVQNPKS